MKLSENRMNEISLIAHKELFRRSWWDFPSVTDNFYKISDSIIIETYDRLHPNYGAIRDFEDRITAPSETGYSLYNATNGMYIVVYNQSQYYKRQIWTLAHEFGHIILEHHKIAGVTYSSDLYDRFESEANFFASEFLAPTPLIQYIEKECGEVTQRDLEFVFCLSGEAAIYRLRDYEREKRCGLNRQHYKSELQLAFGERVLPEKVFHEMYVVPFETAVSV